MAGRPRRRARLSVNSRRRRVRRWKGALRRVGNRRGRGRRVCRSYGYSFTAHKVPKRLRRRHRRGIPGMMRGGQVVRSLGGTRRRRYWLGTMCKPSGRLKTFWDRGLRSRRRRRRR